MNGTPLNAPLNTPSDLPPSKSPAATPSLFEPPTQANPAMPETAVPETSSHLFTPPPPPAAPPAAPAGTYEEHVATASRDAHATDRNPGRNPGKTLGIIGLALAVPVAVLGLIFSIVGLRKSKKAGQGNVLAWLGVALSTLVILGSIAAGVFAFTVLQPAFSLAQACAEAGPGQYTDQNGTPVTCP